MELNWTKFLLWLLVALYVFCRISFVRNQSMLDKSKNGLLNFTVLYKHSAVLNFVPGTFKAALNITSVINGPITGYVMFKTAYGN